MNTKISKSLAGLGLAGLGALMGCTSEVPFYQRQAFADPVMGTYAYPGASSAESHFAAKVIYSNEGSIGGIGTSGGGGCGCY
ncbi:DUF4266 domain-containing protein [Engelhardtia mirabilis]|uniref:DUF4266 domain-containing protein n=1 Tax=Engelhardtia mirabilis TaxID=2528011 RepID=A0A518BNM2_9BACT|nr:hypothetical protein Pla133_36740 [Planctomycetes bacterium Pla133]QDV02900.1 hypothetical protein Pla86_36720 [Planctomycetes bacterium Pla86]